MPNPLYNVPGYGGFLARREQQSQQQLGDIQKAGALLAIKNKIEEQKAAQAQKQMFQQAGGDLNKVMEAALRSGNIDAASKVARILESQRTAQSPKGYGPGTQLLGPNNEVLHQVPFAPRAETPAPNEVRLVEFYNNLPETDPRKPLIKKFIDAKTRPPEPRVDPLDKPLGAAEIGHWQGPDGKPPPPGTTQRDLMARGYKYVSTAESNRAAEAKGAYATIDRLDELTNTLWNPQDKSTGAAWRVTQKAKWTNERLTQTNKELAEFEAFAKGTLAPLIRAVGEKGNLATEDIERALLLIPSTGQGSALPDTPEVARGKMRQLREWFDRAQGKTEQKKPDPLGIRK